VIATEHAPNNPFRLLERRYGLAHIVERGAGVIAEHRRGNLSHREREIMTLSENPLRHRQRTTQQRLGLFEAL